jgi:GT2 family glycosyltransferase
MIKPITFCIASANNEKEYTKLLLKSLKDHTQINLHEILIFIDSDNQNTYEALQELQKEITGLKLCKNPNPFPIGSQRNVSVMFDAAKNDIVCYLQSDMVVGKDFDKHLLESLSSEKRVLSMARIEPPLHPGSPEKIVKDFGITPEAFDYVAFNLFVDELQKENRPNMVGHFAPFAIYKKTWFDVLGGFDTQFRCSREDSDIIIRMELCGLEMIQTWNACVYHFTCVSSRGTGWYKSNAEAVYKNQLQQHADMQELKRFIRKWGFFGHHPQPVYNVAFKVEVDQMVDIQTLKWLEPYCKVLYMTDNIVVDQLTSSLEFEAHYYSNLRWKYSNEYWESVKHLFNPIDFSKKVIYLGSNSNIEQDIVVAFKYSELVGNLTQEVKNIIENIHTVIDQNQTGLFTHGPFAFEIKEKNNLMNRYKKESTLQPLLDSQDFIFI